MSCVGGDKKDAEGLAENEKIGSEVHSPFACGVCKYHRLERFSAAGHPEP